MHFKPTVLMFVTCSLTCVYLFIAFSDLRNLKSCIPHTWKPDAYQIDQNLHVEVMYKQGYDEVGRKTITSERTANSSASRDAVKELGLDSAEVLPTQPVECTASDVNRRSGTIVLTTTNAAYLDFTENWLESIRRTRACPNISVVTEDDQAFKYLSHKTMTGLNVFKTQSGMSSSGNLVFDTKAYKKFVNKRQGYILDLLEQGWDVLFSDVDTFWMQDPFPFFQGNFDMALEEDIHQPRSFCAGFVYFRPTEKTMHFVREWIRFMANDKTMKPDQVVMNMMIRRKKIPGLNLRILNSDHFPNGKLFFNEKWRKDKRIFLSFITIGLLGTIQKLKGSGTAACG